MLSCPASDNDSMKNLFWIVSATAALSIAGSIVYFLLVYIPARDRTEAEAKVQAVRTQSERECSTQAQHATEIWTRQWRINGGVRDSISGGSNHYNRKLQKCFVEIDSAGTGNTTVLGTYLVDAYEVMAVLSCTTMLPRSGESRRDCLDADSKKLEPEEADKRRKALMSE